jgi:hypothetical protein
LLAIRGDTDREQARSYKSYTHRNSRWISTC